MEAWLCIQVVCGYPLSEECSRREREDRFRQEEIMMGGGKIYILLMLQAEGFLYTLPILR